MDYIWQFANFRLEQASRKWTCLICFRGPHQAPGSYVWHHWFILFRVVVLMIIFHLCIILLNDCKRIRTVILRHEDGHRRRGGRRTSYTVHVCASRLLVVMVTTVYYYYYFRPMGEQTINHAASAILPSFTTKYTISTYRCGPLACKYTEDSMRPPFSCTNPELHLVKVNPLKLGRSLVWKHTVCH